MVVLALVVTCIIIPHSAIPIVIALGGAVCLWVWVSDEIEKLQERASEEESSLSDE